LFKTKRPQKTIFDHDVYLPPERIKALHKTWAGPFRDKVLPLTPCVRVVDALLDRILNSRIGGGGQVPHEVLE
jgi:hypothetical protein